MVVTGWDSGPLRCGGRHVTIWMAVQIRGAIAQTLVVRKRGKQYQIVFALSGNWGGGDEATKDLRVSAAR